MGPAETTFYRLKRIESKHGEEAIRTYELGYREEQLFSLLTSVSMYGRNGESEMPPIIFDYWRDKGTGGELVKMRYVPPLEGLVERQRGP